MLLYLVHNNTARLDGNFDWEGCGGGGDFVHLAAYGCFVIHTCEQWTHKGAQRQGRSDTQRGREPSRRAEKVGEGWWGGGGRGGGWKRRKVPGAPLDAVLRACDI